MRMKMFLVASITAILALTGCAYPLALHSRDGSIGGVGEASSGNKSMTISIGDRVFTGSYIFDSGSVAPVYTYGSATAVSGARTVQSYGSSYGTAYVPGSNSGQAFLRSLDGGSLRCQFRYIDSSGLGECVDNLGRQYDLVIGRPK